MPASIEMQRIPLKTGVTAALATLMMAGSAEAPSSHAEPHAQEPEIVQIANGPIQHARVAKKISSLSMKVSVHHGGDYHYVKPVKVPPILKAIRGCESGGGAFKKPNYRIVNMSGHGGAYQFDEGTWNHFHGWPRAEMAPKETQDRKAVQTLHQRGSQPWAASYWCWGRFFAPVGPKY